MIAVIALVVFCVLFGVWTADGVYLFRRKDHRD